jgi:hypothetical protein
VHVNIEVFDSLEELVVWCACGQTPSLLDAAGDAICDGHMQSAPARHVFSKGSHTYIFILARWWWYLYYCKRRDCEGKVFASGS